MWIKPPSNGGKVQQKNAVRDPGTILVNDDVSFYPVKTHGFLIKAKNRALVLYAALLKIR